MGVLVGVNGTYKKESDKNIEELNKLPTVSNKSEIEKQNNLDSQKDFVSDRLKSCKYVKTQYTTK